MATNFTPPFHRLPKFKVRSKLVLELQRELMAEHGPTTERVSVAGLAGLP
jgi:hypothetical protein